MSGTSTKRRIGYVTQSTVVSAVRSYLTSSFSARLLENSVAPSIWASIAFGLTTMPGSTATTIRFSATTPVCRSTSTSATVATYVLRWLATIEMPRPRLVFRLAAGGRMIFRKVDSLEGRTTGCGLRDAHTALVVRDEDFFPNYARVFAGLPEWDFDAVSGVLKETPEELLRLPARTALHPSGGGRKFKAATTRGDDFFDWDTNMFHFYGAVPIGGTYAVYESLTVEDQIASWEREHGDLDSLKAMVKAAELSGISG